jgi:hypothetical protein
MRPEELDLEPLRISTPVAAGDRHVAAAGACPCCKDARDGMAVSVAPPCTIWTTLEKMLSKHRGVTAVPTYSQRLQCLDWMFQLSKVFELSSFTVHLAVTLVDSFMASVPGESDQLSLVAVSSLKLADVFSEISKEYYKQDNAKEYADVAAETPPSFGRGASFLPNDIVAKEKEILRQVGFDLHIPTLFWFTSCYLCIAGYEESTSSTRLIAEFLADLSLLDEELQGFPAPVVAQVCVVLGVVFAQRAIPGSDDSLELMCDAALAQWTKVKDLVLFDDMVEVQMCWNRTLHVVTQGRRAFKLQNAESVEHRHMPTTLKLSYPPQWPTFPMKYLSR